MGTRVGDRALVLGGSITALFAASVLAKSYDEVVLVDRDKLIGVREARAGAPQGRHINGLLARGSRALEELFPEITAQMISAGCPLTDLSGTVRWYFGPTPLRQIRAGLLNVGSTRPVLEAHVRERVQALPNVRFMEEHSINGLVTTADRTRVTGARVQPVGKDGVEEVVEADLVVDATGAGSRAPVWLESLGCPRVTEDSTRIGLGYASRHYRLRSDPFGTDHSMVCVASPMLPRGAIFTKTDSGKVELTVYGILGDHPPVDPDGFNAFVKTLAAPQIYEAIVDAEVLDDPVLFKFPATMWRRFDKLTRMPERFLVMGDAVCTPNPVFAQAQTLAALEALALRDHLAGGKAPRSLAFQKSVADIVRPAWEITDAINLTFPGVEGKRTRLLKLQHRYMTKLIMAATRDAKVTEAFMRIAGLVDSPEAMMRPTLIARVLLGSLRPAKPNLRRV